MAGEITPDEAIVRLYLEQRGYLIGQENGDEFITIVRRVFGFSPKVNFRSAVEIAALVIKHGNPKIKHKKRKRTKKKAYQDSDSFYRSQGWRTVRYIALKNAEGKCNCCGATAKDGLVLHVDHIKPRSHFPELALDLDNLQVLCEDCNIGKGAWDDTHWKSI